MLNELNVKEPHILLRGVLILILMEYAQWVVINFEDGTQALMS